MTDNLEELERLPVDSGMDAATVEKAEWLWTHLPILTRWHAQPTYVKALVCRAIRKIEADATAREVEGLRAEVARLRAMVRPQWFYLGDDQSSDQCHFSVSEVIDEDFFGWGEAEKAGKHLVHVSTAMPGPDIWVVVQVLSDEDKDERGDDGPWIFEEYDSEEAARAALEGKGG